MKHPYDPGKLYSLFGGPNSYYAYGPGQADYITSPGPNQLGPLINIPDLMPGATRGEVEKIFKENGQAKDKKLPQKGAMTAQADTVQNDGPPVAMKAPVEPLPPPDFLDNSFLLMADLLNAVGMGDTKTKLYSDVVGHGRTAPITEKDITGDDAMTLRNVVDKKRETSPVHGSIGEEDYRNAGVENKGLLGKFDYDVDDNGNITARDTYDFNLSDLGPKARTASTWEKLQALASDPTAYAGYVGTKVVPDLPGKGIPVNINLGNTENGADMEIRSKDAKGKTTPAQKKAKPPTGPAGSAPGSATPPVQGTKGDMEAPGTGPLDFLGQVLSSMFAGGIPNPGMGGGTTTMPKGGSPFTAQPTAPMMANPFMEMVADPSIIGNQGWGAETVETPPVPGRNPKFQQGAPTMKPGMPAQNPLFHAPQDSAPWGARGEISGANDMRSIGMILNDIFGPQSTGIVPPNPQRNPMFTGGV